MHIIGNPYIDEYPYWVNLIPNIFLVFAPIIFFYFFYKSKWSPWLNILGCILPGAVFLEWSYVISGYGFFITWIFFLILLLTFICGTRNRQKRKWKSLHILVFIVSIILLTRVANFYWEWQEMRSLRCALLHWKYGWGSYGKLSNKDFTVCVDPNEMDTGASLLKQFIEKRSQ